MKKVLLLLLATLIFVIGSCRFTYAQDLIVGTYNIRYDSEDDKKAGNGWKRRCPLVAQQILFNDFDIFGAQEVLINQLEDLLLKLPEYGYTGVGREDGKVEGEYVPIFYKKERFRLVQSGNFWLSENTDYPNKGWDAALPRICTWGQFKDLKTEKEVWFFNVHFDHVGEEARRQSANLILSKVKEMCGNDAAVILTGDFNVDQTNESYKRLASSGVLRDTYEIAKIRYALNGTFNSFKSSCATSSRIDHIFVSNKLKADRYGILTDTYRTPVNDNKLDAGDFPKDVFSVEAEVRMLSDHFPIKVALYYDF
ncbi:MAG: endonuclease/exonuclease/phosphatase family protein [Prevotellaceae bacterium]|jgi:endonuclease/exonuclease/phosphatase family metal-dependent hydrolase|nr:endonuclease/exonuclease/phosphatase family protein [Prevotellaceae bacterium]